MGLNAFEYIRYLFVNCQSLIEDNLEKHCKITDHVFNNIEVILCGRVRSCYMVKKKLHMQMSARPTGAGIHVFFYKKVVYKKVVLDRSKS